MNTERLRFVVFDWGGTLMCEDGPEEVSMAYWPSVRAIEGAREVVEALAARYSLAVASNATVSGKREIVRALERVGLSPFISEVFCYRELGRKKCEPAFWRSVLTRLGAEPDELIVIGDSLPQDVLGPRGSGIRAIWFNGRNEPEPADGELVAVRRLTELVTLLGAGPAA